MIGVIAIRRARLRRVRPLKAEPAGELAIGDRFEVLTGRIPG